MHILRKGVLANSSEDLVIMLPHHQRDKNINGTQINGTQTNTNVETTAVLILLLVVGNSTWCTHTKFSLHQKKKLHKNTPKRHISSKANFATSILRKTQPLLEPQNSRQSWQYPQDFNLWKKIPLTGRINKRYFLFFGNLILFLCFYPTG